MVAQEQQAVTEQTPSEDIDKVCLWVNGKPLQVARGVTVAAALLNARHLAWRRSVSNTPRGPFCGMGICFECCATVDGQERVRTCQVLCRDGMSVQLEESR